MSDNCIKHIEDYWKVITERSHEAFSNKKLDEALLGYKEAMYRAEVLSNNIYDCIRSEIPFEEMYVLSCHNLTKVYEELGEYEKAKRMLQRAISYLVYMLKDKSLENKDKVQQELRKVIEVYHQFIQKNDREVKKEPFFYTLTQRLKEKEFQIYN